VDLDLHAQGVGQDVDREVVSRRAQPSRDEDERRAGGGLVERPPHVGAVVAAARHPRDLHAQAPQLVGQPRRVRVDDLAAAELVSDGEDLALHARCSMARLD
jgi:hypothetical protein